MVNNERRFFQPKTVLDLRPEARERAMSWVTVRSWHSNMGMRERYPEDEWVGYVEDFGLDIPQSELLYSPDPSYLPDGWPTND